MRIASAVYLLIATGLASSAQAQTFKTLYTFAGGTDAGGPWGGVILNGRTLYGTTSGGGLFNIGAVYSVDIDTGLETVLYSFGQRSSDGANPIGGLFRDSAGSLYG